MELIFWIFAVAGTLFLGLKLISSITGLFADDLDLESDEAFKIFSIHSLSGFCMMFGWVGLAAYQQYSLPSSLSLICALAGGFGMMVVSSFLFRLARRVVSQGTRFDIHELIGRDATVYQKITESGTGKLQISVNSCLREVYAIAEDRQEISSFSEVKILRVVDKNTVSVMKKK